MSRTTTVDIAPASDIDVLPVAPQPSPYIKRGTSQFMRVTLALFSAGLATFALLYCVQPILPVLSHEFGISPASSSISLSISTGMLAVGLLFTGPLSDAIGRKPVMVTALLLASICTLLSTMMTSWHGILIVRALIGLSLSGVAAVGMTYLSEEIHPSFVAFSMGLYISGNSIGGMSGRLLSGVFTDLFNWRIALAVIGCFALASALMFWRILPESRHFRPTSLRPKTLFINFRLHWRDKGLPLLFLVGFLLMGSFVTLFNYIGYRLMLSPWSLSQAVVGLLSVAYISRMTRSFMLNELGQEYIVAARAKGLSERRIIWGHALRNAAVPIVTIIGVGVAMLIGGVVVTESVFNLPGLGRLVVEAVLARDYPVIQCFTLVMVIVFALCNLLVDVLSAALDPRIRHHEGAHA